VRRSSVQDKKVQRALKCSSLMAQIEDDMAQVVKAIAEETLELTPQGFFDGMGRFVGGATHRFDGPKQRQ
jgi:hypothetical protein